MQNLLLVKYRTVSKLTTLKFYVRMILNCLIKAGVGSWSMWSYVAIVTEVANTGGLLAIKNKPCRLFVNVDKDYYNYKY